MVAVGNVHNTRMLRFLLVLVVVILTIFIYASYSTTTSLTSTHMHAVAMGPPTPQQLTGAAAGHQQQQKSDQPAMVELNSTGEFGLAPSDSESSTSNNNNNKVRAVEHRKPPHRLPTIDEDALLDGGAAGASPVAIGNDQPPNMGDEMIEEPQYVQNIDAITGNINNAGSSNNNNNNNVNNNSEANAAKQENAAVDQQQQQQPQQQLQQQQPSDADSLMIPTSNLQKFIENADKILKNMTVNSSSSSNTATAPAAAAVASAPTDKTNQPGLTEELQINFLDNNANNSPGGSYAIMPVNSAPPAEESKPKVPAAAKPPVPKTKSTNSKGGPVDPSKGIPAEKIYESGHLNEEIDVERICPSNGLNTKLLILITSAQPHADARMSIRQTWGHYGTRRDISMAFVLGRGTNETVNNALSQENYMYGDLIRGNFIDSYNNLTLKTISSLEWADQHCSHAKFILKTDDDMFINVPKLLNFLKQLEKRKEKRAIYGRLAKKWKPIRNKKSKYYVSTDQFPAAVFPSFTTGPAYVMSGHIVHDLYTRSLKTVYLKLEDVFTTGIVAQGLGIERLHVNEFVNRRISFNPCNIRNAISVHMIKSNEQFDLWKKLLDQTTKCK